MITVSDVVDAHDEYGDWSRTSFDCFIIIVIFMVIIMVTRWVLEQKKLASHCSIVCPCQGDTIFIILSIFNIIMSPKIIIIMVAKFTSYLY